MEVRTVFVGAVEEGRRVLDWLIRQHEPIAGVVTIDPSLRPTTSGWAPFEDLADAAGATLLLVRDLNTPENVMRLREMQPDLLLVVGWTRLVGQEVLSLPRFGAVGFHASLLPRYRGRAPVNWALINDEPETGNTMFFLDSGIDSGDIIDQREIAITDDDDCRTLYEKVAAAATNMLDDNMELLKAGRAPRRPQDHSLATVMPKRSPRDGVIDWEKHSRELFNWVRAQTHPYPGAFTSIDGRQLHIWRAAQSEGPSTRPTPGTIASFGNAVHVSTRDGWLKLLRVAWEDDMETAGQELVELAGRRFDQPPPTT
jgi:methionyl-tRNA formyltransferase